MIRDPLDLPRYTPHERLNHWVVGMAFILLAVSGLALFHPMFWPLSALLGGGTWSRILHPYLGLVLAASFVALYLRFRAENAMTLSDWEWLSRFGEMVEGDDHAMPEQGKYNGGQKLLFWGLAVCVALLFVTGIGLWRAWFAWPVLLVRWAAVLHAATAAVMIGGIVIHVYAAIWVKGTFRAMWYGTVTRAWARQHHRSWYRQVTGK